MTGCRFAWADPDLRTTKAVLVLLFLCAQTPQSARAQDKWSQGLASASASVSVEAEISRQADTAHLELRGLKTWNYEIRRDGDQKVTLVLPPMDEASVARLQSFNDPLVTEIEVDKNGPDGNFRAIITLAQKDVEFFDYLTDEPSRLIIDFYRKVETEAKPPQVASGGPAKSRKTKARKKEPARRSEDGYTDVPKPERKPAGDEFLAVEKDQDVHLRFGLFDGGDENYDRFRIKDHEIREEAIISSRDNTYLPFPMLKMNVSLLDRLMSEQPEYVIHPKNTRENKEARLLLTLFQRNRQGLFLRTYNYFVKRYPESEYLEIIKNLAAHVHLKRWRETGKAAEFDAARTLYTELIQRYPESPLREHNSLILGFAQMEHGEALATLQVLQRFLKGYPNSPDVPQVRKAIAESLLILRKYDDAVNEYRSIIKDFPGTAHAHEARYRLGDVDFAKGDYSAAIRSYEAALADLPAGEKVYPNAMFNMAEARFWQKDFKKSLGNYVQFVNLYPTHEYGGYALTRIGELLGVLGADQRRVIGAFLESYFRFPDHPGAQVARIRMLSQQMRGMKEKEVSKALEEIEGIKKKLDLRGIEEFTTLMVAEGLSHRGEYRKAIDKLISHYQKNPTAEKLESFRSRILRNISNELKDAVDRGDFMTALSFHSQYANTWLKNADRIDVPFFVAGAFESAGAYPEARKIYSSALDRRKAIAGSEEEKEKKVQEHLPSVNSLHLRLASVLVQDRKYIEAYRHLKDIGEGRDLSEAETVERVRLSAQIAEHRNDHERARAALLELANKWKGDTALLAPVHLQLAQTYLKTGDSKAAESHADQALGSEGGKAKIKDSVLAGALLVKGDALLAQKKSLSAVEAYQNLLERFEDKMPLASVRYKVGQILFDRGDLKGASDVWSRLQGTPNEFLWKVGNEKIEDTKWRDSYRKYVDRIPAMANRTEKEKKP
ncbi:MAG: tetratricopeptide repeat protein [Bdellovibrionales bacterium]